MKPECPFDLLVLGGGITGISFASLAARQGKSCLLVEKNDFASGTSQASGMMIWGGLLYLKNFEFRQVGRLCRARDGMMERLPDEVAPRRFAYMRSRENERNPWFVRGALTIYQILSGGRRAPVRRLPASAVAPGLDAARFKGGWSYEEGFLRESDARFTLHRLLSATGTIEARNHCEVREISHDGGVYRITLLHADGTTEEHSVKRVVNCCGVWADGVNARHGISTRHAHHLSKGVYLLLPKAENERALVVDMGHHNDTLCWVPWGEVVMWGPTETTISDLSEASATAEDVAFLLERLNHYSRRKWTKDDIVNVRCGVRPLACARGTSVAHPMELSRKAVVEKSPEQEWWTVFGGKLSGAANLANRLYCEVFGETAGNEPEPPRTNAVPVTAEFFNGSEIVCPVHSRDHERCRTLEDYLRRRTNLAQWIPMAGFGQEFEFKDDLRSLAAVFHDDPGAALEDYKHRVMRERSQWYD